MSRGRSGVQVSLGGKAVVCCIHDREKRVVKNESQVAAVGARVGLKYDPKRHRIHKCACCDNLFVDPSDEPIYCHICRFPPVHPLGGPIDEPKGPVDG